MSPAAAQDGQQPPGQPTGLQITTEAGSLDVSLDWDDVDGAARYLVRWRQAGPGHKLNEGEEVTASNAAITVESHGEWVVRLEACNDNGCGQHLAQRFEVEAAPESTPEPVTNVPGQPTGLGIATQQGSLDVSLDWDDVDGADSYKVRWRKKDGEFGENPLTPTVSNTDITVSEHGRWVVHVEACNDEGCGEHLSGEFNVVPAPEPTPEPDTAPLSTDLAVSITAFPTSPAVGQAVSMAASISNAPSGGVPSYKWEMDFGYWLVMGSSAAFSYMAEVPETWNIRVTVSYGSGETATSDPVTIEWAEVSGDAEGSGSDAGSQSEGGSESTNQAPVVDEDATNYDAFTGTHNAPRGTLVQKSFDGIFSDPDGGTLTYTVSVPNDRDTLVSSLGINSSQDKVLFEYDDDGDWGAADPVLPDPLSTTVTLTATDPDGAAASITGKFSVNWESQPKLLRAESYTQPGSDPPVQLLSLVFDQVLDSTTTLETSQFTVKAFNADSTAAGTIGVNSVAMGTRGVDLTLATVPDDALSLTVDYAAAADKPLTRSGGGDPAASFTGQAVTKLSLGFDPETARANANGSTDYDSDGDGLIEINTASQLGAVRWDTDGNGTASTGNEASYAAAFPDAADSMGCADTDGDNNPGPCTGYELTGDITLTGDWSPIGGDAADWYRAIFEGNGHAISGLRVNSPNQVRAGLFTGIGFGGGNGQVRNLGIIEPSITANGSSTNITFAGALAGDVHGSVKGVYVRGGTVTSSSTGTGTGTSADPTLLGGLAGNLAHSGSIANSYSTATVSSTAGNVNNTGGLVGMMRGNAADNHATIDDSYAAGAVSNVSSGSDHSRGGLVGALEEVMSGGNLVTFPEVNTSFYDSTVSGQSDTSKGTAKTTAAMLELGPSDFSATTAFVFAAREYPKLPFDSFDVSVTLLSNLGQASAGELAVLKVGSDDGTLSTAFTTGTNTGNLDAFLLTAVQLVMAHFDTASPAVYSVTVHEDNSGFVGMKLGTLVNPGSLNAAVDTFAAPSGGIALSPGVKYWVRVTETSGNTLDVDTTQSDREDPESATGWDIPDNPPGATELEYHKRIAVIGFETGTADIESVRITSLPKIDADNDKRPETYRQTDVIEVTVRWEENVAWSLPSGTTNFIRLKLNVGGTDKDANLVTGGAMSGTSRELKFQYTVASGDTDSDGVFPNPDSSGDMVQLGGAATISDTRVGDPVSRAHAALAAHPLHKVNAGLAADTTAPRIDTGPSAVYVNGPAMTVSFNELLAGGTPSTAAFTVSVDGVDKTPIGVQKSDHRLLVLLPEAVLFGQVVTLSYNPSNAGGMANQLQDRSGNRVAAFSDQAADNQTRQLVLGTVTLADECAEPINRGESVAERWDQDAGCDSVSRPGAYARYYTFAPGSDGKAITATLSSPDTDVWVYLWEGSRLVGSANSVGYARADLFSRITPGQNYIFEVTTSERARTGRFLLGLSGDAAFDPPAECRDTVTLHGRTLHSQWGWPCASSSHPGSYARYHTFTVTAEQNVQFEVWSSQVSNVRMYLRQGTQASGRVIATSHHPPVPNGGVRARMTAYLIPGTYTVESVAVNAGRTGVLQFRTLQGPAPWQPPDQCVGTIPLDRTGNRVNATWGEPCWSNAHPGRHSRWYTFEVTERSQVSLTLLYGGNHDREGVDTYVYLRGGRNFTGWAIAENDHDYQNHPDGIWHTRRAGWHWSSSAIDRVWLEPGTYTIEATSKAGFPLLQHPTGAGPFSITFQRMD